MKNPDAQFRGSEEGDDGEGDGEETMFQCSRVAVSSAPGGGEGFLFLCTNRALPRASLGQRTKAILEGAERAIFLGAAV